MIERKTVLVLGAGASIPYGFPTGEKLLRDIVDIKHHGPTPLENHLRECGFLPKDIQHFVNELNRSGRHSVDAFLEHRTEFERIGKAAMIAALIPKEDPATILDHSNIEHWFKYLFKQMGSSLDEISKSKLSVITFNYDRSLEYFLLHALQSSFKLEMKNSFSLLGKFPVIHLHGQLGVFLSNNSDPDYRGFETECTPDIIERCIPQIKIIHEVNVSDNPQFIQAHALLEDAERICFLGFGYDKTNVQRLLGNSEKVHGLLYQMNKQWFGTALGFTQAEVNGIKARLPQGFNAYPAFNNLQFLRETGVLERDVGD
jgi:hypothetical protein